MKLTTGFAKNRNQSAQSAIFSQLGTTNGDINASANARVNTLLNNSLSNKAGLLSRRAQRVEQIRELNTQYVQQTQNVLNDKALAFLVEHSNIDAPTFTSIMAGFELARASRADKLNEQREFEIENIQRRDEVDQQVADANDERTAALISSIDTQRKQDNALNLAQTQAESKAIANDIQQERTAELTQFREDAATSRTNSTNATRREVAQINASGRGRTRDGGFLSRLDALRNQPQLSDEVPAEVQQTQEVPSLVDRVLDFAGNAVANSTGGQIVGALIDEAQSGFPNAPDQASDQAPTQQVTDTEVETAVTETSNTFAELSNAAIQDPSNPDNLAQLNNFAESNDLSRQQRELIGTLTARGGLQSAFDENPEDAQLIDTIGFLDSEIERQNFELSPEFEQQQLEAEAQAQLDSAAQDTQAEINRLQQGLEGVNNILGNENFTDEQKQGSVISKQNIEARLEELGAL